MVAARSVVPAVAAAAETEPSAAAAAATPSPSLPEASPSSARAASSSSPSSSSSERVATAAAAHNAAQLNGRDSSSSSTETTDERHSSNKRRSSSDDGATETTASPSSSSSTQRPSAACDTATSAVPTSSSFLAAEGGSATSVGFSSSAGLASSSSSSSSSSAAAAGGGRGGERGAAGEQQETQQRQKQLRRACPYLGTIKRHLLDFDFEKICSICLSNQHVYACLVCARYFQGRGRHTYAHMHALQEKHYVYINLKDCRVYCLPDNYEVRDASLDDIVYNLRPTYTERDVQQLSSQVIYGKALDGTDFIPGCVGLNNLRATDYCNVLIQALCAVIPLRSWLLLLDVSHIQNQDAVLVALGELMRKIFNAKNFKGIVSPHEFLQAVGVASKKKFRIGQEADPLNFFSWLMHRIQKSAHHAKINSAVVEECFQGEVLVKTTTAESEAQRLPPSSAITPFLYLTLDLPQAPIFKDSLDRNMIPHVPIFDLLQKFNGEQILEVSPGTLRRYSLWRLPKYLLLHLKRFSKNNFYVEKNPTIATFPVKHLDLRDYIHADAQEQNPVSKYNLVANICHQGKPHDGRYKVHVLHAPTNEWFEIEDLRVTQVLPQFVALSESYIQIYQRQDVAADGSVDAAVVEAEQQELRRRAARAAAAAAAPDEEEDIFAAAPEDEEEEEEEGKQQQQQQQQQQ